MRLDPLAMLVQIQARLRSSCHAFVNHDPVSHRWVAGIQTVRNEWPFWIRFDASTPHLAIDQLQRFIDEDLDDVRCKRSGRAFLAPIQTGAPAVPGAATSLEKSHVG